MVGTLLLAASAVAKSDRRGVRNAGTFRISLAGLDSLDPARSYSLEGWSLIDATCARLMANPDRSPPAGSRVVPEVATAYPKVSSDGTVYTFTLRSGFRFSDGTRVRGSAFARAIERTLAPAMNSPGAQYSEAIVGADDVQAGKRSSPAGVTAHGNRLVIRLTRPVPDFPAQLTTPFFCAVPPTLPVDPEGVAAFPAAGPYYVAEYRPGQRAVIKRNRFYGGKRPHHVDGFLVELGANGDDEVLDGIERGRADWGVVNVGVLLDPQRRLAKKYGVNKARFFVRPGVTWRGFALNTSRPLFRNNARLRRAINFAIDRPAFPRLALGTPLAARITDQYLPPAVGGFKDARIYPLKGPDVKRARALARGHTRSGKAVLYTFDNPVTLAHGQILKRNLAKIGLDVEVKAFSLAAFNARTSTPGEPYDIAALAWGADYLDPYTFINLLLDGRFVGKGNIAWFDSPRYNRLLRRAAGLHGAARLRAYGKLDVRLARDAAPLVAISVPNDAMLVSKRVGCVVTRPVLALDLPAACLKG